MQFREGAIPKVPEDRNRKKNTLLIFNIYKFKFGTVFFLMAKQNTGKSKVESRESYGVSDKIIYRVAPLLNIISLEHLYLFVYLLLT